LRSIECDYGIITKDKPIYDHCNEPLMLPEQPLVERWQHSPWREAVGVVANASCTKEQFSQMLKTLYPEGGEISVSDTHRGRVELYDFRGLDLSGRNLQGVDFYKFDLRGGKLSGSNITGTCFDTAQLEDADFSDATASDQANFAGCFGRRANFSNVKITRGFFSGADFSNADFSGAIFERCDFSNALMVGAVMHGVTMVDCDVQGLRLSEQERESEWLRKSSLRNLAHLIRVA